MAKLNCYALHDQAINEYIGVEMAKNHAAAERKFRDSVNDPQTNLLYKHPEQFTLFWVGEYESETGRITGNKEGPIAVTNGVQCKQENGQG